MTQSINLKDLEKSTWSSIFQSGLVDIVIGLIFVVGSICMIFSDISYYLMPLYLIPAIFIILTNKYIVTPRMGIVKFSRRRKRKTSSYAAVTTTILIVLVILTAFSRSHLIPEGLAAPILISAFIFAICISIAFFLDFKRMYIYAFLITGAFILSEIIRANPGVVSKGGYAYILPALIMSVIGCVYFVRFIRKYPLPTEESTHGN